MNAHVERAQRELVRALDALHAAEDALSGHVLHADAVRDIRDAQREVSFAIRKIQDAS
jgi:hypothetical protein